jgi:N-acetylmuramic acid 6-phosphate etherase
MTEDINPRTADIDRLPTLEMLQRINAEDATVAGVVASELPAVAAVVDAVAASLTDGGRLIYAGAGTSGWLGALDAAECVGTFGTEPAQVRALVAGGLTVTPELGAGVEDDEAQGERDVAGAQVGPRDVVIGITASGRTPYVLGALRCARARGARTVAIVAIPASPAAQRADLVIAPATGPEAIAGSTRMKAATAQKLVLNMISTGAMIRLGRTYGNLMVNLRAHNAKLRQRALRVVVAATGADAEDAERALAAADGDARTAIVMLLTGANAVDAGARLARAGGLLRAAL